MKTRAGAGTGNLNAAVARPRCDRQAAPLRCGICAWVYHGVRFVVGARSWKTLVRSEKNWAEITCALRRHVDVALTLFGTVHGPRKCVQIGTKLMLQIRGSHVTDTERR